MLPAKSWGRCLTSHYGHAHTVGMHALLLPTTMVVQLHPRVLFGINKSLSSLHGLEFFCGCGLLIVSPLCPTHSQ